MKSGDSLRLQPVQVVVLVVVLLGGFLVGRCLVQKHPKNPLFRKMFLLSATGSKGYLHLLGRQMCQRGSRTI